MGIGRDSGPTDRNLTAIIQKEMRILGNSWGRFNGQVRMSVDECLETWVVLGIRNLPRESTKDHTEEYDGQTPYVGFSGVI